MYSPISPTKNKITEPKKNTPIEIAANPTENLSHQISFITNVINAINILSIEIQKPEIVATLVNTFE